MMSKEENGRTLRSIIHFNDRLGCVEAARSLDYFRCIEYLLVLDLLDLKPDLQLLDLGVGKGPFSSYLASEKGIQVLALDIAPKAIGWQAQKAGRLRLKNSQFMPIVGDSRSLSFADESFDRVLNLGSIEHVPGDGDRLTAKEMGRVLRTGGRAIFSIPYGRRYTESDTSPHVRYFERRYDEKALQERIIQPSGLKEISRFYFGEPSLKWSRFWYSVPFVLKLPFRRATRLMASRWLSIIPAEDKDSACGICFALAKE